jgi:oligopeptidase B
MRIRLDLGPCLQALRPQAQTYHRFMLLRVTALMTSCLATASAQAPPQPPVAATVPYTVKSPQGGRPDEYHWLRDDDPKAKRPEVMRHLEAENAYAESLMAPLQALRDKLQAELRGRIKEDESTPPAYDNGWWTWREFKPGKEFPLLWRQRGTPEKPNARAPRQLVLDQNERARGQAYFKLGSTAISPDGHVLAWTEDTVGRRIHTLRFKDLRTGQVLEDSIPGVLEDLAWANDSRTLFYILQDPVTLQSGPVYRHRLGTPAGSDVKVYDEADKTLSVSVTNSASRKYVLVSASGFDTTETRAIDAHAPRSAPRVVLQRKADVRHSADHLAGRWVIQTNEGARNFKLVAAPQRAPDDRRQWRTLVPGREQVTIERFALMASGIALQERVQADSQIRLLQGTKSVPVAVAPATVAVLGVNADPRAAHLRYLVTSMVQPATTWDLHLASGKRVLRKVREVPGYDATLYATDRIWAPARDGKQVPVTLAWRGGRAQRDGQEPLLVIGYGSYGMSYDAAFSAHRVSLMDRGFIIAIAHVRGGADLGEGWYEDGRLMNKKNTFNDFVDATRALVQGGWSAPGKVFASGGSAGGLLMGVIANEAPQLYRGIVADVPFVDVVTTMLDETIPLTTQEWAQWGDPRQKAAYDYMLSYSPYDNVKAQDYPALLVTTGLWDAQVQYFEPAKWVARLRMKKTDRNPLLLFTNLQAGHGGASGRFAELAEIAREYAFLLDLAGVKD